MVPLGLKFFGSRKSLFQTKMLVTLRFNRSYDLKF